MSPITPSPLKSFFKKNEVKFLVYFSVIFIISITLLSAIGLIPSEFRPDGGATFEQIVRNSVREIIEGKSGPRGNLRGDLPRYNNPDNTDRQDTNTDTDAGDGIDSTNVQGSNAGNPHANTNTKIETVAGDTMYAEEPTRIVIDSVGIDTIIRNPIQTTFEVLDSELTKGVVRYPGSGLPGIGNMFIFGHSTGFSIVQNKAYKVFNKLKDLKDGQVITVYSPSAMYQYSVTDVRLVDKSKALVEFDTERNMLTLSTCNSFGKEEDRYVVEADLISVQRI